MFVVRDQLMFHNILPHSIFAALQTVQETSTSVSCEKRDAGMLGWIRAKWG